MAFIRLTRGGQSKQILVNVSQILWVSPIVETNASKKHHARTNLYLSGLSGAYVGDVRAHLTVRETFEEVEELIRKATLGYAEPDDEDLQAILDRDGMKAMEGGEELLGGGLSPKSVEPVVVREPNNAKRATCGHVAYRGHANLCIQDGCPNAAYLEPPAVKKKREQMESCPLDADGDGNCTACNSLGGCERYRVENFPDEMIPVAHFKSRRQVAIEKEFCELQSMVWNTLGLFSDANDGFCNACPHSGRSSFRSSGKVLDYIRRAAVTLLKKQGFKIAEGFDSLTGKLLSNARERS